MNNGVLVPRIETCWVCSTVAVVEDVTVRLFNPDGTRKKTTKDAAEYIRSIGYKMSDDRAYRRLLAHAKHVEAAMHSGPALPSSLTRIEPPGAAHWLDVNQNAVELGNDAMAVLAHRIGEGIVEDKELVAVAKLGVMAAQKVGDWEAKGRKLAQVDELIKLASGYVGPDDEA